MPRRRHRPPPTTTTQITPEDRALALPRSRRWLDAHLERLAAVPAHGNRRLHVDQLFHGLLLAFFQPLARSLRTIEAGGNFDGQLDVARLARSTTADALAVFDPALLKPVIDDLLGRVPDLGPGGSDDVRTIARRIVAADGTYLSTLADVAWALKHTKTNGKTQGQVRLNVQLDTATWCPRVISVSGDDGEGEPAAFARDLQAGVLYVVDRNVLDFAFLNKVLDKGSDVVLRLRARGPSTRRLEARALTADDVSAGVVADELVELTGRDAPPGRWRIVTVHATSRQGKPEVVRLLTSLGDADTVAARVVGAVYRQRWQVELFFKWLKTWAGMDHLLSTSRNGITFQFYVAVIAVLMMYVQTGRRVSIYALQVLGQVARGQMALDEAMTILARFQRERDLDRARQARRRARKKLGQ